MKEWSLMVQYANFLYPAAIFVGDNPRERGDQGIKYLIRCQKGGD